MARGTAVAAALAIAAAASTAALAGASAQGWVSGEPVELFLAVGLVVPAVCVGWLLTLVVIAGLLRAATLVPAPARPFGLERILRLMELQAFERETRSAAERGRGLSDCPG